jgi:hypothetical protein
MKRFFPRRMASAVQLASARGPWTLEVQYSEDAAQAPGPTAMAAATAGVGGGWRDGGGGEGYGGEGAAKAVEVMASAAVTVATGTAMAARWGAQCSTPRSHYTAHLCRGWVVRSCTRSHTKSRPRSIGMRRSPGSPSLPRPGNALEVEAVAVAATLMTTRTLAHGRHWSRGHRAEGLRSPQRCRC